MGRAARVVLSLPPPMGGDRSLLTVQPSALVWQRRGAVTIERPDGVRAGSDLLDAVMEEIRRAGRGARAVGFLAYEFASHLDPLVAVPRGVSLLPDAWWAVVTPAAVAASPPVSPGSWQADPGACWSSLDDQAFCRGVERIRADIGAGEVYQVNLTRRFSLPFQGDPAAFFAALGRQGWPPLACYLADREQGWAVLCLSPELLLKRHGATVETRPIKGTRPLPGDLRQRRRVRRHLAASAKDAAELAMIVDLERNDFNRVCLPFSVEVRTSKRSMATLAVMHLYAVVTGHLEPGTSWRSLLTALLPGGSVTGAPKLAACAAIAGLEPVPRAVYCGAIGIVGEGRALFALPIRTGYVVDGMLHFHSGCGVTWDSSAAAEEAESRAKVARWFEVLQGGD